MDFEKALNQFADGYRAKGYDIVVRPGSDQLPDFAKDFKIEIVGRRAAEGVLVIVKKNRDELAADSNAPRYAEITNAQPGWRLDLAILEGENPMARELRGAREFSEDEISQSLEKAGELSRIGFPRYGMIAAWAALEAAMRIRLRASGEQVGWGSPPRQMLRELYSAGAFTPDEFRRVELASQLRNQIVHGFAPQPAEAGNSETAMVQLLSDVTRRLVSESHPMKQPA